MGDHMRKAIQGWQLAATWLLCALLMAASLDKIPDPPAVGPHGNEAKTAGLNDHREGSLNQSFKCAWPPVSFSVVVRWLDLGKAFAAVHQVAHPSQMRQASDSSPPAA